MQPSEELQGEVAALRERLSRLSEASRRINESLDFQTVLQGVLDSARDLTSSQYGVITLFAPTGQIEDFLASGFTPEEARELWEMPQGSTCASSSTCATWLSEVMGNPEAGHEFSPEDEGLW